MSRTIGVVGCGRWGANVVRDLLTLGAAVFVADPDPARREWARAQRVEGVVCEIDQLPVCDGYVVVTPASAHRTSCEALLDRGVPVFVEKPPCTSVTDVGALASSGDGRLFVMHKWRSHPGVLAMGRLLAEGALGAPVALATIRTGPELLPPDVDVAWHLGVHDLAIALELFGSVPRVRSAEGEFGPAGRLHRVHATLVVEPGVEHSLVAAAGVPDRVRELRLVGAERTAVLARPDAAVVSVTASDGTREEVALPQQLPLERLLAAFLVHCGGGPRPNSSATEALAICEQLAAIAASARQAR